MTQPSRTPQLDIGFLTVLHEPHGYLGGYLVTNRWGRPLEFRLSTAVQPNRVHHILYGETLERYLYADLIGKALYDRTATRVQLLLTDTEPALDLRRHVSVPIAWLSRLRRTSELDEETSSLACHHAYPEDSARVAEMRERLDKAFDLAEPFTRIREAIAEARKMGVTHRAA